MYGKASVAESGSELLQLKFSAYDSYQGTAEVYKSFLVNCKPKIKQIYKVFQGGLNRKVRFELSPLATDDDRD
jgi:hypothetical protein